MDDNKIKLTEVEIRAFCDKWFGMKITCDDWRELDSKIFFVINSTDGKSLFGMDAVGIMGVLPIKERNLDKYYIYKGE